MLKVYTAVYRYSGPDRLDITVKGKDPIGQIFAPIWDIVMGLKKGVIDEDQYEREYRDLMLASWGRHQKTWQELLSREEVTLVCFCPPGAFCHRLLLAKLLEKVGAVHMGERNLFKGYPTYDEQMSILDVKRGIVCHQVNCRGVMGAGIAKAIRQKWPVVYHTYRHYWEHDAAQIAVGKIQLVQVEPNLLVANLFGQDGYGRDKRYTDYIGLMKAIKKLAEWRKTHHELTGILLPVYFPYKMGCSLGGGSWYLVHSIIKNIFPDAVIVCHN